MSRLKCEIYWGGFTLKSKRLSLIGGVAGITLFAIVGCGSQPNVALSNKTTAGSTVNNNTPSNTVYGIVKVQDMAAENCSFRRPLIKRCS